MGNDRVSKIHKMSRAYADATGQKEPFMYASHPGDGRTRYVFQDKTCLGFPEAERYMASLLAADTTSKETA